LGRIDFPSTEEGFEEFKQYVKQYIGSDKMKLLIIKNEGKAILRTRLATRYDSAYIAGLSAQQLDELEKFVGDGMEVWHPIRFFWDEQVKVKVEQEELI